MTDSEQAASLQFSSDVFASVPIASSEFFSNQLPFLSIPVLLSVFCYLWFRHRLRAFDQKSAKLERQSELLRSKIAHDLQSPVMALKFALYESTFSSTEKRELAETSIRRIEEISHELLKTPRIDV